MSERTRNGRPVLTRERIGRTVLDAVARGGVDQVTMRSLAADLSVTVRALYKLVRDRDDALAAAAALAHGEWRIPDLDPTRWERDLVVLCRDLRGWYRRYPGLLRLVASIPVGDDVPLTVLRNGDRIVGFLLGIGLAPPDALRGWDLLIGTVAGFTEMEDWAERAAAQAAHHPDDVWAPTPDRLLADHDLPHLRAVTALAPGSPDERFADTVEMLAGWIAARR